MKPQSYGRYKVLELLGEGAMGRVFLSEDPILKRQVAVKVISTDRHLDPAVLSEYLGRFTVEAQACARLNHQSIVSIYDAGEEDGVPWIAFEYVKGEHLDKLIKRQKQLPAQQIIAIASDIAAALNHAHGMNIVHRDVKPANILIDDNTKIAKLSDFGVVKSPFTTLTENGAAVGSPGYMSPEQIDGTEIDCRSDIFSFGIVLYEMLTGVHPFLRDTVQATCFATVKGDYTPVKKLNEKAPDRLVTITERCLIAERNGRIKNSKELCALIAGCSEEASLRVNLQSIKTAGDAIGAELQNTYALTRHKIKKGWRAAEPFCKRKYNGIRRFCNDKALPAVNKTFYKTCDLIKSRYSKSKIMTVTAAVSGLAALVVIILLIGAIRGKNDDVRRFQRAARGLGYTVTNSKALIDSCNAQINRGDLKRANELADVLIISKQSAVHGKLFKAMAAMSAEKYREAFDRFFELKKIGGGNSAIRRERPFFINHLEERIDRELPAILVNLYAEALSLNKAPQIKAFTKSAHYWRRWNAARILKKAGDKVDLAGLYILDLEYAESSRTKINAAEKLGELGDKRAIPALRDVRDSNGEASKTARNVLREKFNVR